MEVCRVCRNESVMPLQTCVFPEDGTPVSSVTSPVIRPPSNSLSTLPNVAYNDQRHQN